MSTIIQTKAIDIKESLSFYEKLNFKVSSVGNSNYVSDGKATFEVNSERYARSGIKLYRDDWTDVKDKLAERHNLIPIENGYLLSDYSGCWIYLLEGKSDAPNEAADESFGILGNFAGLSLETTEMKRSTQLWESLGFSKTMGGEEQGWISFANADNFTISIMKPMACPHSFYNPSVTYFNGKNNLNIIESIRQLNIPITEEIDFFNQKGIVDNIIIRDPGGFCFFIFSD